MVADSWAATEDEQRTTPHRKLSIPTYFSLCFVLFLAFVLFVFWWLGPSKILQLVLQHVVPERPGWMHAFVIGSIVAILMAIPFPILFIVMMVPGMMFGFWIGALILFIALLVGTTITFLLGRWAFQEQVRDCIAQGDDDTAQLALKTLETRRESFWLLVLFRFLLSPFFVKNYGPSILDIPLWKLVLSSIPHHIWVAVLFASFGSVFKDPAQLLRKGDGWDWSNLTWQHVLQVSAPVVSIVLSGLLAWSIYKKGAAAQSDRDSEEAPLMGEHGSGA
mmetsp:Transcript_44545/g.123368  ORF Transcript_44545/g.123368 Transcript_44545/m.123368 type:complete len:277 (+) Transcript_44545:194-1024(+)|eukprot:CAMPEP_0117473286 /NCGR_PEP_ID=MMETSP0784-20121206/8695_1 /TAXON_ID=39447 /ORGANISM="" /LENGTH=276 /DNA_ID=CAMNT_0005267485 /DNA_START=191 /DNA_END=1021 /DNA_ORIENTATION=-